MNGLCPKHNNNRILTENREGSICVLCIVIYGNWCPHFFSPFLSSFLSLWLIEGVDSKYSIVQTHFEDHDSCGFLRAKGDVFWAISFHQIPWDLRIRTLFSRPMLLVWQSFDKDTTGKVVSGLFPARSRQALS